MNANIFRPALAASAALLTFGLTACTPPSALTGTGTSTVTGTSAATGTTGSTSGTSSTGTPDGSSWSTLPQSAQGSDGPASAAFTSGSPQDFDTYMVDVINNVNQYWSAQFGTWSQTDGTPAWGTVRYMILDSGESAESACRNADGTAHLAGDPDEFAGADWSFWCQPDSTIYLSSQYYYDHAYNVSSPSGTPVSDFGVAMVIAHEFGHVVQSGLGLTAAAAPSQTSAPLELQADCLSGVWANAKYYDSELEPGDVEEAVNQAVSMGDDTTTYAHHGTSAQRSAAFMAGYNSGDASQCTQTLPGAY